MDIMEVKQQTPIIDEDQEVKTALSMSLSINDVEFDLVYNAKDESFDGAPAQIASGIVNFAKQSNCNYAMLSANDCWVSTHRGISLLAQIESDYLVNQFDIVVLPLDEAIYIAELTDLIVTKERVQHIDQALAFLRDQSRSIGILQGGKLQLALENNGYTVNVNSTLHIDGKDVVPYRFEMLSWVLIKNKLFHISLLTPVAIVLFLGILPVVLYLWLNPVEHDVPIYIEPHVVHVPTEVIKPPPVVVPVSNNNAAQMFNYLSTRLTGPSFDFLKTCRLVKIDISPERIIYTGEKMDNTKMSSIGCGYRRLQQVTQEQQLKLELKGYNWTVTTRIDSLKAHKVPYTAYVQTMDRLQLVAAYIDWDFRISKEAHSQSNTGVSSDQAVTVIFSGEHLQANTIDTFSEVFRELSADFKKGTMEINPETLSLANASFEISVHTTSESAQ